MTSADFWVMLAERLDKLEEDAYCSVSEYDPRVTNVNVTVSEARALLALLCTQQKKLDVLKEALTKISRCSTTCMDRMFAASVLNSTFGEDTDAGKEI